MPLRVYTYTVWHKVCENDYSHIAVREIIIHRLFAKFWPDTDYVQLASSYGAGYK